MFKILIQQKDGEKETLEFNSEEISIGRIQGNDIVLPKGNVSKRHSRIVKRDSGFVVVDLRSTNGTYVNGRKITSPMVVSEEDKIYIGDFVLQIEEPAVAEDPDATRALEVSQIPPIPQEDDEDLVLEDEPEVEEAEPEPEPEPEVEEVEPEPEVEEVEPEPEVEEAEPEPEVEEAEPEPEVEEVEPEPEVEEVEEAEALNEVDESLTDWELYVDALSNARTTIWEGVFALAEEELDLINDFESIHANALALLESQSIEAPNISSEDLATDILYEIGFNGPIDDFLSDENVTDIYVNGFDQIYVTRNGVSAVEYRSFSSQSAYEQVLERLIHTHAFVKPEANSSIVRGKLPQGASFQIVAPPLTPEGPTLQVSRAGLGASSLSEMVENGKLSQEASDTLSTVLSDGGQTIVVASHSPQVRKGMAGALCSAIPIEGFRLAVLEGAGKVLPPHDNVVFLDGTDEEAITALKQMHVDCTIALELGVDSMAELLLESAAGMGGLIVTAHAASAQEVQHRLQALLSAQIGIADPTLIFGAAIDHIVVLDAQGALVSLNGVSLSKSGKLTLTS